MTGFNEQSTKMMKWINIEIQKGIHKKQIERGFIEKFGLGKKTFHNLYVYVTRGKLRNDKTSSMKIDKQINGKDACYFCEELETEQHHINYYPQKIVWVCLKCHHKLHTIIKEYHQSYDKKDDYIKSLEILIENVRKIVS